MIALTLNKKNIKPITEPYSKPWWFFFISNKRNLLKKNLYRYNRTIVKENGGQEIHQKSIKKKVTKSNQESTTSNLSSIKPLPIRKKLKRGKEKVRERESSHRYWVALRNWRSYCAWSTLEAIRSRTQSRPIWRSYRRSNSTKSRRPWTDRRPSRGISTEKAQSKLHSRLISPFSRWIKPNWLQFDCEKTPKFCRD